MWPDASLLSDVDFLGKLCQELEQELEPKEEQIENLNQQLQEQDGELVEELKRASVCVPANTPLHTLSCPHAIHHTALHFDAEGTPPPLPPLFVLQHHLQPASTV